MHCNRACLLLCIVAFALATSCGSGSFWPEYTGPPPPDDGPRPLDAQEQQLAGLYDLIDVTIRRDGSTLDEAYLRPWSGTLRLDADRTGSRTLEVEGSVETTEFSLWFASTTVLYATRPGYVAPTWRLTDDGVLITIYQLEGTDYESYSWGPR